MDERERKQTEGERPRRKNKEKGGRSDRRARKNNQEDGEREEQQTARGAGRWKRN